MLIEYREGDLIGSRGEMVIAHGCNALGKFDRGFAGALNLRMPEAKQAYMAGYERGAVRLGAVIWARAAGRHVANCVTQPSYGRTGLHIDYAALRKCMRTLNAVGRDGDASIGLDDGFRRIALPLIGADRGGGDWSVISSIIEEELTEVAPVVYFLPGSGFRPPVPRLPGF